jgi:hypothetical protein
MRPFWALDNRLISGQFSGRINNYPMPGLHEKQFYDETIGDKGL